MSLQSLPAQKALTALQNKGRALKIENADGRPRHSDADGRSNDNTALQRSPCHVLRIALQSAVVHPNYCRATRITRHVNDVIGVMPCVATIRVNNSVFHFDPQHRAW